MYFDTESAEWIFAAKVQEWFWMAEVVGRFHQLLSFLLQVTPGNVLLLFDSAT